jgi:hypothetical protein
MIEENPSIFEHWDTPLEITEYVNCCGSPITHLSKHLTFLGQNKNGEVATFEKCKKLKSATGTFKGTVEFRESNIEKIEDLNVGKNEYGSSASFYNCQNLKIATGTFHGCVNFAKSGIEKIEKLHITQNNKAGWAANFRDCNSLPIATGHYPGFVDFEGSGIKSIQNLHTENPNETGIFASFWGCNNLNTLENWDLSKKIWVEAEKIKTEHKRRKVLTKFIEKTQPEKLPFL